MPLLNSPLFSTNIWWFDNMIDFDKTPIHTIPKTINSLSLQIVRGKKIPRKKWTDQQLFRAPLKPPEQHNISQFQDTRKIKNLTKKKLINSISFINFKEFSIQVQRFIHKQYTHQFYPLDHNLWLIFYQFTKYHTQLT